MSASPSPPRESPAKRRKTTHTEVSHAPDVAQAPTSHPRDERAATPRILVPRTPPRAMLRPASSSGLTTPGSQRDVYDNYENDEDETDDEPFPYKSSSEEEDEDEDEEITDPRAPTPGRKRQPAPSPSSSPDPITKSSYQHDPDIQRAAEAARAAVESLTPIPEAEEEEEEDEDEVELHEYAHIAGALDDDDDDHEGIVPMLCAAYGSGRAASPHTAHGRYQKFLEDTMLKIKAKEGVAEMIRREQEKMRPPQPPPDSKDPPVC